MQYPLQLTFRGIPTSESIADYARKRAQKLDSFRDRIIACRVVIEAPPRHHQHGSSYRVRIELSVPGSELVTGGHSGHHEGHQDLHATIDDAFDDAQRLLRGYVQRLREGRRATTREVTAAAEASSSPAPAEARALRGAPR